MEEQVRQILNDHGVVCITRYSYNCSMTEKHVSAYSMQRLQELYELQMLSHQSKQHFAKKITSQSLCIAAPGMHKACRQMMLCCKCAIPSTNMITMFMCTTFIKMLLLLMIITTPANCHGHKQHLDVDS